MKISKPLTLSFIAVAAALNTSSVFATTALQGFSGSILATSGSDQLYGWAFNVVTPINVVSLGVFDKDSDGLAISHDVGIFRVSDTSLMGSTTIPAGTSSTLDAGFRYENVGSFSLAPGAYVIAMTMPDGNPDLQNINANSGSVIIAAEIQYTTSAFDEGTVLHFPNPLNNGAFQEGMFGPNFQFEGAISTPDASSTFSLATIGFGLLIGLRRNLRK